MTLKIFPKTYKATFFWLTDQLYKHKVLKDQDMDIFCEIVCWINSWTKEYNFATLNLVHNIHDWTFYNSEHFLKVLQTANGLDCTIEVESHEHRAEDSSSGVK